MKTQKLFNLNIAFVLSFAFGILPCFLSAQHFQVDGDAFINTEEGDLKLGAPGGLGWRLHSSSNSGLLSWRSSQDITGGNFSTKMILNQDGQLGIGPLFPDEDLVIGIPHGDNLNYASVSIGDDIGGTVQIGGKNSTRLRISSYHSSIADWTFFTVYDKLNRSGRGPVSMRTTNLNIGYNPGFVSPTVYPVRIQQNTNVNEGNYGLNIYNGNSPAENWEIFVSSTSTNNGDLRLLHADNLRGSFDATSGNYSSVSDARLKTNISALSSILPLLGGLSPKKYEYRSDPGRIYHGFLAQDLQKVFPDMVTEVIGKNGGPNTLVVDYAQLSAVAIAAMQEQQKLLEEQNKQLMELMKRVEALEKEGE